MKIIRPSIKTYKPYTKGKSVRGNVGENVRQGKLRIPTQSHTPTHTYTHKHTRASTSHMHVREYTVCTCILLCACVCPRGNVRGKWEMCGYPYKHTHIRPRIYYAHSRAWV